MSAIILKFPTVHELPAETLRERLLAAGRDYERDRSKTAWERMVELSKAYDRARAVAGGAAAA